MPNCIVCNNPNANRQEGDGDFARFDCPRCGSFALSGTAEPVLMQRLGEVPFRRSLMSHTLRRMQRPDQKRFHVIGTDELPTFWREERLPSPLEQADNLILWIGDNQMTPHAWAETTQSGIAATIGIGVSPDGNDSGGWAWLNTELTPKKLYRLHPRPAPPVGLQLELAGWEKYEALKKRRIESRTAFMALKFGNATIDRMVEECARPAVRRTGFELRILTDQQDAGLIDNQIRAGILSARFLISDLTQGSYGAYWEAGFGEGRGIPVVYTCEKADWQKNKTHFDTNHMATIIWDINDLKAAENALVAMIRATLRAEAIQTDEPDRMDQTLRSRPL
jgi:hypothetical protein